MKLFFIVPCLQASAALAQTLESIGARLGSRAEVILVCPQASVAAIAMLASEATAHHGTCTTILTETSRGVYPAYNDGTQHLSGNHRSGFVIYMGVGDRLILPEAILRELLEHAPDVACFRVAGDPTMLEPASFDSGRPRAIRRLAHHQGMIFKLSLGQTLILPERHPIYADVLQRGRAILRAKTVFSYPHELVSVAPAGISGVRSLADVLNHVGDRVAISRALVSELKQHRLALRYLAGITRVFTRWAASKLQGSRLSTAASAAPALSFETGCKKAAKSAC